MAASRRASAGGTTSAAGRPCRIRIVPPATRLTAPSKRSRNDSASSHADSIISSVVSVTWQAPT
jgi:hypothetical protein